MQHDPLQQGTVHGENPQQDVRPLPAEEVQQVREVHHVSRVTKARHASHGLVYTGLTFDFHPRDNILVLDVFFEALNYETIEQKKAYEVAGLLGEFRPCLLSGRCCNLAT